MKRLFKALNRCSFLLLKNYLPSVAKTAELWYNTNIKIYPTVYGG